MDNSYPGVLLASTAQKRGKALWIIGGALMLGGALYAFWESANAVMSGDTSSTTRVRGFDVPTWSLGPVGLAAVVVMWLLWRSESGVVVKREALATIQPTHGGLFVVGNYGAAKGVSLPIQDQSSLRIALVKTGSASYGLIKLYGLRLTSPHGDVLMDVRLMPRALDLSPLMAELRRRRVTVELDPALASRHDHGTAPHPVPPVGPAPSAPGWDSR